MIEKKQTMSTPEARARLRMRTNEKFDGSVWRNYETPDNFIVLTGVGRKLVASQNIVPLLHGYIDEIIHESTDKVPKNRRFLAEGGNAKVFSVGNTRLVVKEKKPGTDELLLPALERMDKLSFAIEKNCPRWIDIPKHYGVVMPKHDPSREFMLIEKIDDGITVGDILHHDTPREPHLSESVLRNFGPVTPELRADISKRWDTLKYELRDALMAEHMNPDELLPDMDHNEYNILVEHADTPIAGSPYKFWIIDQ
jgi:hypothetical protein